MKYLTIALLVLCFLSCSSTNNGKAKQQEERCDSSYQKETEDTISETTLINKFLKTELSEDEIYNDSILYGFWFKPHEASSVNIFFHKDKTFHMSNYYVNSQNEIVTVSHEGHFEVKNDSVYLHSKDGKIIALRHWNAMGDGSMYISFGDETKGYKYWLVKGSF